MAFFAIARTFLSGVPWKLIVLVVGIVGLLVGGAYVVHQIKENGRLEAQLDSTIDISNANFAAAQRYAADVVRRDEIAGKAGKAKNEIRKQSDVVRASIIGSLPADDGILAPVLRTELDRLPAPDPADPSAKPVGAPNAGVPPIRDTRADAPANWRNAEIRRTGY